MSTLSLIGHVGPLIGAAVFTGWVVACAFVVMITTRRRSCPARSHG